MDVDKATHATNIKAVVPLDAIKNLHNVIPSVGHVARVSSVILEAHIGHLHGLDAAA